MLRSVAGPMIRPARLTAVGLVALAPMALPAAVGEVEPSPKPRARLPAEPILTLPELGRFSYRCDGERRFSVIFAQRRVGATVYATVVADGRNLHRTKRVDPGRRLTTPLGRHRSQRWRLLYNHKPGRITARVDLRFRVDAVGDCFVSPVSAVVRTKSHAARPEPRASGRWRELPGTPRVRDAGYSNLAGMVVWGGSGRRGPLADGASYDPTRDRWQRIAAGPLSARARTASVWTGAEMVVWGGDASRHSYGERDVALRDGAAYDPATNRWRRIARAPIAASADAEAVWTGETMLLWTGREGAAYDPSRDRWRQMPRAPLTPRQEFTAVWDGTRMLVWGGVDHECGDCFLSDGAAYRPTARSWRLLPRSPLARRDRHAAVPTPRGMAIFGGCCKGTTRLLPDGAVYESK